MSEDPVYFNQMIWNYPDKLVSESNLNVSKFVCKDNFLNRYHVNCLICLSKLPFMEEREKMQKLFAHL